MTFVESLTVLVVAAAVASFGAAAFIRSNVLCIAASWVIAELLFALCYQLLFVLSSDHTPQAVHALARGVSITVVFGAPFFLVAVIGFTFLARWIYRKIPHDNLG